MKKIIVSSVLGGMVAMSPFASKASELNSVGVGINYGLFAGPTLELTYPINNSWQVRGALSSGMDMSETATTDIEYKVKTKNGINRLALDYHPFENSFFLSAGYAVNNFNVAADAQKNGSDITIGDTTYSGNVTLNGTLDWNNAPSLSLGWGNSPEKGWGGLIELGAIFTGTTNVNIIGTGTLNGNDVSTDPSIQAEIAKEEKKVQDKLSEYDFLPILQAGVTYRF
ncbi:hypothetical protein [Thiomicrorhabdus sp.]|uniref:hypothetical protein n=1 Tax=Thiomicrorhabdus sp. TaxID=2039724 RepID=UPI002AA687A5|nr:hypothetical protein [Thiomicrorhabdus sp.]